MSQRDLQKARERDARLLADCGGQVQPTPRQNVQPALVGGCLDSSGHAAVGTLFPQAWLETSGSPVRMDEILGCGWRLLLQRGADPQFEQAATSAQPCLKLRIQSMGETGFHESSGLLAQWFERMDCQAVLIRPDHYVYGAFKTGPDLRAALLALQP